MTSIEIDGTPLVPGIYVRDFWDILRQAALTVCVLACFAGLLLEPVGENGVASGLNACNLQTTLIQNDSIYTKIWARSWKNPVPRPR